MRPHVSLPGRVTRNAPRSSEVAMLREHRGPPCGAPRASPPRPIVAAPVTGFCDRHRRSFSLRPHRPTGIMEAVRRGARIPPPFDWSAALPADPIGCAPAAAGLQAHYPPPAFRFGHLSVGTCSNRSSCRSRSAPPADAPPTPRDASSASPLPMWEKNPSDAGRASGRRDGPMHRPVAAPGRCAAEAPVPDQSRSCR